MARPNPIRRIMETPLPGITYQRRKQFRPTEQDIIYSYNIINRHVFKNQLTRPEIQVKQLQKQWGNCSWSLNQEPSGSHCVIRLVPNWFCVQWFMNTLAHEMVHQYQWDIHRHELQLEGREIYMNSGAHGPSFFAWRDDFEHYGLYLKTWFGQKRWFKHQDFNRC